MTERINTNPHILHFVFKRNKNFPNNHLPVLIYKEAFNVPLLKNKAAVMVEHILARNGWGNSWRNGIYDFHHYHSNTHECMAICAGSTWVILGGPGGKKVKLSQNDVIILPAGVGHKCLDADKKFLCVGAYPQNKDYDINYGKSAELENALKRIHKLAIPAKDPLYGKHGFLRSYWK